MKFAKGGLIIESNSPVCDSLYLKQGWLPVIDELIENKTVEVTEETNENGQNKREDEIPKVYTKGDFTTWSKEAITELANSLGYAITATKKAEMIEEFLKQQEIK